MVKMQNLEENLEILSSTSKRDASIEGKQKRQIHKHTNLTMALDPDAVDLVKELDGLPLALATAGVYLEQTSTTFKSYLQLYKDSWARLQLTSPELDSYEDRTLYSTWQLSYDQIQQRNENSAALLRLWAYFDNQDLWLELLQHKFRDTPAWIREVTADELSFNDTVRVLINYGLVEVKFSQAELVESRGYSVHSCVHSWITHVLNKTQSEYWAKFAMQSIAFHGFNLKPANSWLTQRRLLKQAARCHQAILDKVTDSDDSWICNIIGLLYADQWKLKEAEEMFQKALQNNVKALGPDHLSTLITVSSLGTVYRIHGKLEQAEEMYQRVLRSCEKTVGPDHLSTLTTVNNLGILYYYQGKLKQAEEMFQRALRRHEKAVGT